ncbi:MAG TPA: dienelactone hydrolase family protein [Stellaceae bacterium]|jgi:carboxymethylenebutenolidase|nr:dienelactone hydrolase family protein [Stellaceae bacterium]
MRDRTVAIPTAAGKMETFITHPEEGGPFPPVIIYMDFWGLREELFDIARRVGTVGYYCMVPDLYYRQGRVRNEWRNEKNEMISAHRLDPERRRQASAPLQKLSNAMVIEDTGALLDFIDHGEPVRPGGVGSIGYCMGGRHVLCAAGAYPERFVAGASLHGTLLVSDRDDSPHRLAGCFRGELYCGFAEHDPHAPPEMIRQLGDLLADAPVTYRHALHLGAEHGYALPNRDIYDKAATNRDWEQIFAMFRRQLPLS